MFGNSHKSKNGGVVTRFAPSPTGLLQAGNYRTALFDYIFTVQNSGKFILRIEDTDKARSKKEFEDNIIESLEWLHIKHDEFFRQSERTHIYRKYIEKLISHGSAYVSKEEGGDRAEVIRFKNPKKKVSFNDLIRGKIEIDTTDLGDFVIAKSLDEPLYHFVVVVDDYEMAVTHIIRGEDHISNTPRHILLQEAMSFPTPLYAHIPLLLAKDRSKLSKRKGALPMTYYRDKGYLPEAMINYLAFLGWNPGNEQELMSIEEIIAKFSLEKVQKSGAIFDEEKLRWFNKKYIEKLDEATFDQYVEKFKPEGFNISQKLKPLIKEKIHAFGDIAELLNGELSFVSGVPEYDAKKLMWKDEKDISNTKNNLKFVINKISEISDDDFTAENVKQAIWPYAEEKGRGNVLWPMRYALSGIDRSPDPFTIAGILGKEETIKRLTHAYEAI